MDAPELNPVAPETDTIVAISTPPGRGGIGIVRLSGPQSASIAAQLVRLHHPLEHARARLADVLDSLAADSEPIDEAIVTFFAAPNSYTAEDLVEIAAHGSPVVLELCSAAPSILVRASPSPASSPSAHFSPADSI